MNILTGPRMYMGHMYMYIVGPKEDQSAPFRKSGVTVPQVPKNAEAAATKFHVFVHFL